MAFGGVEYVATAWALCFVTLVFVSLRLFLRYNRRNNGLNVSDWLVVIGWLNFVFQTSVDTKTLGLGLYNGKIDSKATKFGPEVGLATYDDTVLALKLEYVEISFYYTEMYCVKWAMIAFYYELFPKSLKRLRIALHSTLVLTILGWISSVSYKLFGCQPIQTNWVPGPHYCDTKDATNSNVYEWAFHVFTDILIYILPLFLLKNLTLPRKQKIGVGLTFAVGFICIVFANLFQISLLMGSPIVVSWLLSALEQTWSLIVVCCPTFRALVTKDIRQIFRRTVSSVTAGTNRSRTGGNASGLSHGGRDDRIAELELDSKERRGSDGESDGDAMDEEVAVIQGSGGPAVIYERKEVTYRVESVETLEQNLNTGVTTTVQGGGGNGGNGSLPTRSQSSRQNHPEPFHFV